MSEQPTITRKLTTILSADAANYSGLMAQDEEATVRALRKSFDTIRSHIQMRGGRVANTAGDGLIAEFPSVVEAAAAAVAIQKTLNATPDGLSFRLGLHLGDVIVEGEDLLGDGVNLAARLQEMAPKGGVFASRQVVDHARGRIAAEFRPLGPQAMKHMPEDIAVYALVADGLEAPGDLGPVLPTVAALEDPAAPAQPSAPVSPQSFFRKHKPIFLLIPGLIVLDILTGTGAWAFWPVVVLTAYLIIKWRKQKNSDQS